MYIRWMNSQTIQAIQPDTCTPKMLATAAADDRHVALIEIMEWLDRLALEPGSNRLTRVVPALDSNLGDTWQRLALFIKG